MQLSNTSQKILRVFFSNPNRSFYINELVRETGLYPNAIFQALKTLENQKILKSSRKGRLRPYILNKSFKFIPEIKKIVGIKVVAKRAQVEDEQKWVKILNRQTSFSFVSAWTKGLVSEMRKVYGVSMNALWYNNVTFGVYHAKDDLILLGKTISGKIDSDPHFAQKDIVFCRKACDRLVAVAKKIPLIDLVQKSNREIAGLLKNFYKHYLEVFPFVTVPHGIENYFERKIREEVDNEEDIKVLLSPVSTQDEERDSALKIAAYAEEHGFDQKFYRLLEKHRENFCWLPLWSIHAEPLTKDYFENEVKNMLEKVIDPAKELKRLNNEENKARKRLESVLKRIKASRALVERVKFLQEYIYLRIYRKNAICQAHYYHLPLLYEAGRRLELDAEEIKLLSYEEILAGLSGNISKGKVKNLVKQRQNGWAILMWKGKIKTVTGTKEIIETMERFQIISPGSAMQRAVKGNIACRGKVIGRVKVVRKLSELSKVEKGDILVTKMTTPDYMVAINKASAIVTDEGGITCHAALVAREANLPCIIGTKNATQILNDNDLVEVDAIEGIVRVMEAVEAPRNIKVIPGKTIYKGKVRGLARIILDASDFPKVKTGDILIAPQTTPEYLSSLYRVKGFIVDEESLTSHAVLYGRALRLPSIMGTNFARNVIQDGEMIELDATNGLVRRMGR